MREKETKTQRHKEKMVDVKRQTGEEKDPESRRSGELEKEKNSRVEIPVCRV